MAKDAIALLDFVGWTAQRSLHVVGISLGGMIAQGASPVCCQSLLASRSTALELATRIPDRIASLTLCVTTAGGNPWSNLPPVCPNKYLLFFLCN